MRSTLLVLALSTALPACGSSKDATPNAPTGLSSNTPSDPYKWDPPPAAAGFTRLVSKTVKDVPPGGDVTYCQYVMEPFDHDVDVLGVQGYQSEYGHHALAATYTPAQNETTGSNFECMGTEFSSGSGMGDGGGAAGGSLSMGAFLGAVQTAGGGKPTAALPDGVAFRLKKGQGVMLNVHYVNTGESAIDGNAVVDLKFADADPNRILAAMFLNLDFKFDVPPASPSSSTADCVAQSDVRIIMATNHMHELGTSASTQVIRANTGTIETLHEDPTWTQDMVFNSEFSRWALDAPFVVHAGDTVRTTCNWDNTTPNAVKFPREMCVGISFALATADNPTAPICADGTWVPGGL